ncbi:MAG: putative formylmethanofuran dehydrogenase subunit F [Promethearchaeota archaeon]|nr:MAG: putative formylmethanofuran dehydrogenase subunit F [Candidatus Lokiarchaeota archaeon]
MSYPKTSKVRSKKKDKVEVQFLAEKLELILDREKCTGCCVCVRVCPKQAFVKATPEGPKTFFGKQVIYKRQYAYIPFIHDPNTCVFCGLCTYCCPFDALRLKKDGKIIPPEEIKLVELKAVPKLKYEEVNLKNGKKAKVYTKGTLSIDSSKCNTGCTNCSDICPTGAIKITPDITREETSFEKNVKMEIIQSKCIYCGACHSICPTSALKLTIDEVHYSGEYNSPFWDDTVKKIKLQNNTSE